MRHECDVLGDVSRAQRRQTVDLRKGTSCSLQARVAARSIFIVVVAGFKKYSKLSSASDLPKAKSARTIGAILLHSYLNLPSDKAT